MIPAIRVLAGRAPSKEPPFTPVKVQKQSSFWTQVERRIPKGKVFGFQPHDFGPSAEEMYRELEERAKQGLVEIN